MKKVLFFTLLLLLNIGCKKEKSASREISTKASGSEKKSNRAVLQDEITIVEKEDESIVHLTFEEILENEGTMLGESISKEDFENLDLFFDKKEEEITAQEKKIKESIVYSEPSREVIEIGNRDFSKQERPDFREPPSNSLNEKNRDREQITEEKKDFSSYEDKEKGESYSFDQKYNKEKASDYYESREGDLEREALAPKVPSAQKQDKFVKNYYQLLRSQ